MTQYRINFPAGKIIKGEVNLPASKSISNRILILDALCNHQCKIKNLSDANDTVLLRKLLSTNNNEVLNCEDAGTTFRFLLTYLSIKEGNWKVTGTKRLFERPVQPLIDALKSLGAEIKFENKNQLVHINGGKLKGGKVKLDGSISSQFISSLILCAAAMPKGLELNVENQIISQPYIDMTLHVLSLAGIHYELKENSIKIKNQTIHPFNTTIENDWSSAAFMYEIASLSKNAQIKMKAFNTESTQGDSIVSDLMNELGVKTRFNQNGISITSSKSNSSSIIFHAADYPDLVPALAVTCAAKGIAATFNSVKHLRSKESDRISSLRKNLEPYGIIFKESQDGFSMKGIITGKKLSFDSFDDHRFAMCLAPLALISDEVIINNPEVVRKSFPSYWNELKKIGFIIEEV